MVMTETRMGIFPPAPASDLLQNRENIGGYEVLTTRERANGGQSLFMVSYQLNELTGRYETTLGNNCHQLGGLPEIAHTTFPQKRGICYLSVQTAEKTRFLFGKKFVSSEKSFLTLNWVSPVDVERGCKQAEKFVVRVDGLNYEQADAVMHKMLVFSGTETKDEGKGVISFPANFDPFDQNNYLSDAIKETAGLDNLLPQQQKLIAQIENQTKARLLTHNPEQNSFEVKPIFLNGKYYVHDMVLNKYVLWEEVTSDQKSLSFIHDSERLTASYLKDPSRFNGPLVISFGIMLSARTAGFRTTPSSAVSQLSVDQFGQATQITSIVPTQNVNPRLFDQAVSNWAPETLGIPVAVTPRLPQNPYPVLPVLMGGGITGINVDHRINMPVTSEIINSATADISATVFAAAIITPGIVDSALFTAPLVSQLITTADGATVIGHQVVQNYQDVHYGEFLPQTMLPDETEISNDIAPEAPLDEVWFDFPDVSIEPLPEPTGGGGLMLSREIKVMVWDQRMEKRFRQAQKPITVFTNKVLPQEIEKEQVVFDALKKEEVKFKEYASDLEVIENLKVEQVEKVAQVGQVGQGDVATLLLANSLDKTTQVESCDKNLHVHEFVTDNNKKHNNSNDEVVNSDHYDTSSYHSKEDLKDELPEQVELAKLVVQEQRKKVQQDNFFIPNALLTNYLLWREIKNTAQEIGINIDVKQGESDREVVKNKKTDESETNDNVFPNSSFAQKAEQHKTQAKKVKIKTNLAFLSLLFLTKIKLLTKVKLLAKKNNLVSFKQLFVTDTLLLFLLNPKLFLVNESVILGSNSDSRIDSGQARMT